MSISSARHYAAHPAAEILVGEALQTHEQRLKPRDVAHGALAGIVFAGRLDKGLEGARELPLSSALIEHHRKYRRQSLRFRTLASEHIPPHRKHVAQKLKGRPALGLRLVLHQAEIGGREQVAGKVACVLRRGERVAKQPVGNGNCRRRFPPLPGGTAEMGLILQ